MYIIAFSGILNNTYGRKDIIKLLVFTIISLVLLYAEREISFLFIVWETYIILSFSKLSKIANTKNKQFLSYTLGIILSILVLCLVSYQQNTIMIEQNVYNENKILQERIDNSQMFGKTELPEEEYIQSVYMDFSYFSFTYLIENYGKIIGILVIGMFILLTIRFIINYIKIKDNYGKLLCLGIGSFLVMQFLVNICNRLEILRLPNVNMPFIVHNDMSIIIYMLSIAIVMSVYRRKNKTKINNMDTVNKIENYVN